MTFEKKFETIQKRFATPNLENVNEKVAIQITLTDEDCGGIFYVAYVDGNFEVAPYDYRDNTATIAIKAAMLSRLLNGTLKNVEKNAEIGGNAAHIALLAQFAAKEEKKPAAKKTTTKKAKAEK